MSSLIIYGFIVLVLCITIITMTEKDTFLNMVAPYGSPSQQQWWKHNPIFGYPSYSYWENFQSQQQLQQNPKTNKHIDENIEENQLMQYAPDTPSPVELYNNQPYHLLNDIMQPPRLKESTSCVNSRACYATDFQRMLEKTGTYRQMTNNYKHNYPDSCTAPLQELVLNFYKQDAMQIPSNHTGHSVSEA